MPSRPFRTEFALLLLLALLWGGSFTLIKIAVETIPPASLTAGRIALAALVLLAVMRWRGISLPSSPRIWLHFLVQSVINLALPFLLISWGEQHVSSGLASILTTTAPLFAFAIAALTGHAARGVSQGFGLVCGFAGVILIIGAEALRSSAGRSSPPSSRWSGRGCATAPPRTTVGYSVPSRRSLWARARSCARAR
jgi:drug/metabolite transporter (DMT)-like permease